MKSNNIFEEKSINQLIVLFSFPTICSLVLESLTSMIDTVFAGHLGSISTTALSAMGIITPLLLILIAAQLIFGVSTSLLISKRLGENDKGKINDTFKVGFYSCCTSSTLISLFIFIFQNKVLSILGANGEVTILAKEYLNIALIFNVFSSMGYMLVNNIRAFGYPKIEVMVGFVAAIINVLFNVIFTFIFNMGMKGIALSTLISEVFYFGFSVIFIIRKGLWIKKSKVDFNESKEILISLVKIGFVQFLMQSLNSVSGFIINKVLITYGSILYIGAWSICSNINMIMLLPLIGLTHGVQSIISYFHGSKNKNKEDMVKSKIVKYSLIYSTSITFFVYMFSHKILNIFTDDDNLVMLSIPIIKIVVISFPLMGIIYTLITFMQVLGQESSASKLELIRQIVLIIPLVIIMPMLFSKYNIMNIEPQLAVFFSMPISTILTIIIYFKKVKNTFNYIFYN